MFLQIAALMAKAKKRPAQKSQKKPASRQAEAKPSVSGPARPSVDLDAHDRLESKMVAADDLSRQTPFNPLKAAEFDRDALAPPAGEPGEPADQLATASTASEYVSSDKLGSGSPPIGINATIHPLDHHRADASMRGLTTNQGIPVADNQNSLKSGLRGPTLWEDFILREKITHFDHERIPERIVHARGSAAHGFFECYKPLDKLTRASLFSEAGKRTPVFVRFSTVVGERGSTDTARDVRGFAVKFYTDDGNWDLVGNNIPVFFIQDAIKFPDLVHAVKPEPHHAMPQAASAHDTFWDFASLMPEISHMLMWVMSDRAIPRSYRTMQGFGVNTYRFVNKNGESVFVKFHWNPMAGTHSLVWDEAVKISGADPDFHRRDLWESIEAGVFPEYELGVQIITEEQAEQFSFDVLDATKLVPEELIPVRAIGRLVLNRNPDNFFAETEQVAFCTANIVPGVDFSNDPLLAGRIHSYVDTQLSRLGGPNFHQIPINAPVAQVHNNTRDGFHQHTIHRGRVSYEPNSLGGGCPFQTGKMGFTTFQEPMVRNDHKVRGKPERFAEHYEQAKLFYNSQTPVEQQHIINAFRFELTKVQTPAVRERMVAGLMNVDMGLAQKVAEGLGITEMPDPLPKVLQKKVRPEITQSKALSLMARPGDGTIRGRKVAIIVANGVGADVEAIVERLAAEGAVPIVLGAVLGRVQSDGGTPIEIGATLDTTPSVVYDALVLPDGEAAMATLAANGRALEFVKDTYRHCKAILALGAASQLLQAAGVPSALPNGKADPGLIVGDVGDSIDAFVTAIAQHRHFARESEPVPVV
jgi:catalase